METSQSHKIGIVPSDTVDIRQSEAWGKYLELLGWKSLKLAEGLTLRFKKTPFGSLVKIQRPYSLYKEEFYQIDKACKNLKALFVKLEPSLTQNETQLKKYGYIRSNNPMAPPATIVIDLKQSEADLTCHLSKGTKYSYNRALREGGQFEFYTSPSEEFLEITYEICSDIAKRNNFFILDKGKFFEKAKLFSDKCHVAIAYDSMKRIMGINMYLGVNKSAWFMYGGITESAKKTKYGYLLYWNSILKLKELGYEFLDLEGKYDTRFPRFTKGWGGFSDFKEKFGGTTVKYPSPYLKIYNPLLKFLAKMYGPFFPL